MGIQHNKVEPHWNYLIALESDLERLSRFVEFDERNFECFSLEISRILLSASAEFDVVCKMLCKFMDSSSNSSSINQYQDDLCKAIPELPNFEVKLPRFGLVLNPLSNWSTPKSPPLWWTAYNKIKHHRDSEYHLGNLKNALNSIAALYVVILYFYRDKAEAGMLAPNTQLLRVADKYNAGVGNNGFEFSLFYDLPVR
jgi:hypothetical protein